MAATSTIKSLILMQHGIHHDSESFSATNRASNRYTRVTFVPLGNQMERSEEGDQDLLSRTILALGCLTFVSAVASAQADRRNELGLLLGAALTPELRIASGDTVQIGSGVAFQVAYARLLKSDPHFAVYFEVPAVAVPLQNVMNFNGALPRNYDSFFATPAMRVKLLPNLSVSPWFSAGGGYALFDESTLRMNGAHNTTRGTSGGAVQFGGGIDLRIPIKVVFPIGFRLEVRDFYSSKPTYNVSTHNAFQHNIVSSGGLVVLF